MNKNRRTLVAASASALVLAGLVLWLVPRILKPRDRIQNVLLISMDTTRADRLSSYGYPRETTPFVDRVADEGVLFENVIAPAPMTLPSHSSMLTGRIPPQHMVRDNLSYALDSSQTTLAEILREEGFSTFAAIGAEVLNERYGLNQGFDTYDDELGVKFGDTRLAERLGGDTTEIALQWMEDHRDERFFMFVHYYDPHEDYEPPEPFAERFQDDLYAGEVAYTDSCIGRILDRLEELDLYDSTLIVITADHGEMLGEHRELAHIYFIYQSAIAVPMIFKAPGITGDRRIASVAGLVDIVPTISSLLGIDLPAPVHGVDLAPLLRGEVSSGEERYIYSESLTPTKYDANSLIGLVGDRWKLIQTTRPELYDLEQDPAEMHNLYDAEPALAEALQGRLRQTLDEAAWIDDSVNRIQLDQAALDRLRSLGYMAGALDEGDAFDQSKDDPKDLIAFHLRYANLHGLTLKKNFEKAAAVCNELIAERPQVVELYVAQSRIAVNQGDYDQAHRSLEKVVELDPDHYQALKTLGEVHTAAREYDQAQDYYKRAMAANPESKDMYFDLARTYFGQGNIDAALKHAETAVELDPDLLSARIGLADAYVERREHGAAIRHLYKIVELTPHSPTHFNTLAWLLATTDDPAARNPEDSVAFAERACEMTNYEVAGAIDTLAAAHAAAGEFALAIEHAERAVELAREADDPALAARIDERLRQYRLGEPYRQKPQG